MSHVFFTFQVQRGVQATSEFQKPSLSKWGQVHNLSCENEFYLHENKKNISISKAERLFWYRGPGELGNGLLGRGDILGKRENPGVEITDDLTPDTFF